MSIAHSGWSYRTRTDQVGAVRNGTPRRTPRTETRRVSAPWLTPDARQQKIMLLVGPKRSSKGTIGRVLKALATASATTPSSSRRTRSRRRASPCRTCRTGLASRRPDVDHEQRHRGAARGGRVRRRWPRDSQPGRHLGTGRAFSEPTLIGIASAFEQAPHHRTPPASTPPLPSDTVTRSHGHGDDDGHHDDNDRGHCDDDRCDHGDDD